MSIFTVVGSSYIVSGFESMRSAIVMKMMKELIRNGIRDVEK